VKKGGLNEKQQKRYLIMTLQEAHHLFKDEHPSIRIERSKFCSLRPDTMMLTAEMAHNLCICKHHAKHQSSLGVSFKHHTATENTQQPDGQDCL